jgi:hypothetical protein
MSDDIIDVTPIIHDVPAENPETPIGEAPPEPDDTVASDAEAAADDAGAAASEPSGPSPSEAWDSVRTALGDLGDALSAWAKAATDSPENRKHLDELRAGVNDMASQANDAFASMASGDFGKQVSQGADEFGRAVSSSATEFGQAAAPHVASAFAGLADAFGRAAQKMGEAAAQPDAEPYPRTAPQPPAAEAPAAPEPAATTEPEDLPDDARE